MRISLSPAQLAGALATGAAPAGIGVGGYFRDPYTSFEEVEELLARYAQRGLPAAVDTSPLRA